MVNRNVAIGLALVGLGVLLGGIITVRRRVAATLTEGTAP